MSRSPTTDGCSGARLVLASRSPRRRQLLSEAGVNHEAIHPGIDDSELSPGEVNPAQWVASLAYLKAEAGATAAGEGHSVFLGADTACVLEGQLIGTPRDAAEAESILRRLSGRTHEVLTGVALLNRRNRRRRLFTDRAVVTMGRLTDQQISEYIASGDWKGKAGAYNLADRLDAGWPIEYSGDPTTIMGLPMQALASHLIDFLAPSPCGCGDAAA